MARLGGCVVKAFAVRDRKSTRLNSSHSQISYAVFCLKKKPPKEDVRSYILDYTCVNDFTARDLQTKDDQCTRAKCFDTFCPVGPLVTNEIDPWAGVGVETRVNGAIRQQGNTRDFIFGIDVIVRFISQVMTLFPG